jgi:hypothetical protein
LRIPANFGDVRLANKRWKDIKDVAELRNMFLNYSFIVEQIDDVDSSLVNEIFSRMNKNSRKLTPQELRHARFDGWFMQQVDAEVDQDIWSDLGIVTKGRARRMADAQFISELILLTIRRDISGFSQAALDQAYADYDDADELPGEFDIEAYRSRLSRTKQRLAKINAKNNSVSDYASTFSNMYSLWGVILNQSSMSTTLVAQRYKRFMGQVVRLAERMKGSVVQDDTPKSKLKGFTDSVIKYYQNNQGAPTELPQRKARHAALEEVLFSK